MLQQHIPLSEPNLVYPPSRAGLSYKFQLALFYLFVTLTAAAVFIPLNPRMPQTGLDLSWHFAMNQAVAQHLRFGKEIMFTYGPYAAVCDRSYHPATDLRMLSGSALLGISYVIGLLFLAQHSKRYLALLVLLFLATFASSDSELLLFTYPFLYLVCALQLANSEEHGQPKALTWRGVLAAILMSSTLGLLPLVKGSLLAPAVISMAIPSAFFLYRARFRHAILSLLVPIAAIIAFWIIAGQRLGDLPPFLHLSALLTSGYTEAMSMSWGAWPTAIGNMFIVADLVVSALIFWSVCRSNHFPTASKWFFVLFASIYLLITFKLGFVRAPHLWTAYASLAVFVLIIAFSYIDRLLITSLAAAIMLVVGVSMCQDNLLLTKTVIDRVKAEQASGGAGRQATLAFVSKTAVTEFVRTTFENLGHTYRGAWDGIRARLSPGKVLQDRFNSAVATIRTENPLPRLNGTADIYAYDQSVLIASGNQWDTRPILQSYSAYTPLLPKLNEEHLRAPNAPDWVLFNLETIDGRLPPLDDGMSWPALFDNYSFAFYQSPYVYLRKKRSFQANSIYDQRVTQQCKLDETVELPKTEEPTVAEIDFKPTLLGKLAIVLFKPPQLQITLNMKNGKTENYRIISNMTTTGFLLSPLVRNTSEFASLEAGGPRSPDQGKVTSFSIAPTTGGSLFWSRTYALTLEQYRGRLGHE